MVISWKICKDKGRKTQLLQNVKEQGYRKW